MLKYETENGHIVVEMNISEFLTLKYFLSLRNILVNGINTLKASSINV